MQLRSMAIGALMVGLPAAVLPSQCLAETQPTADEAGEAAPVGSMMAGSALSVTDELLETRRKELESNQTLDEGAVTRLTEVYDQVGSDLSNIKATQAKTRNYSQFLQQAGEETRKLQADADGRKTVPPWVELGVGTDTPLETIGARLLKEKADRAAAAARFDDLSQQIAREGERPTAVRQRLVEARTEQARVAGELKLSPPDDQDPALIEGLRWQLEAQAAALSAELLMLEQELLSQPARVGLLKAQREQQEARLEHLDGRIRYLESMSAQRRKEDVRQAKEEARVAKQDAVGKHPLLGRVAQQNIALSNELQRVTAELEQVSSEDDRLVAKAEELEEDFRNARQKLEITGLSEALGQVLLQKKRQLPDQGELDKEIKRRETLTVKVTLRQLQHAEDYKGLRHLDDLVAELTEALSLEQSLEVEPELMSLLSSRKDIVERFQRTDADYLRALSELAIAQTRLLEARDKLDAFLSKRLLWIRSAPAIGLDAPGRLRREWGRLGAAMDWGVVQRKLWARATQAPTLLMGLLLVLWLRLRIPYYYRVLRRSAEATRRPSTDRFRYSVKALVYTLLIAAPWPLLMALLGWELGRGDEPTYLSDVISRLLLQVAPVFFLLSAFRALCKPGGLAIAHFRWPGAAVDAFRRQLTVFIWSFVPAVLVVGLVISIDPDSLGGEWGRLGLTLLMGLLLLLQLRLFAPQRGVLKPFMDWAPASLLARWRVPWRVLAVSLPVSLAVVNLLGYSYTAVMLLLHLMNTISLIIVLVVVQQMALRWLLVSRRRIALRVALEKREARLARDSDETQPPIDDHDLDVVALSQASRKLVNMVMFMVAMVGLWSIWRDVVPALGIFSDIKLWHRNVMVGGAMQLAPVTLADLILGLLVLGITVIAAKRLPALLELILIQVFDMGPGGRYTVTTLTGYVLVVGGALYVFAVLGVDWSKLQWLVAALGVGIGFGLQEIVANFISGLIILFERPIRVGDVVTVGAVDGVVTRIRIRATTIRNWDNKELLVPNKEFITTQLMNWTLSDAVTRIQTGVGVAYGSDIGKATELMLAVAAEHEQVLEDPAPSVIFQAFGANSLDLVLRCFIANSEGRMGVVSALNRAINDGFQAAGLEIAFPQQDVHLDTKGPLEVMLRNQPG